MAEANELKQPKVTWREVPGWIAAVIALTGIFLTYWEIRTANEREIIFRVWDDVHELFYSVGDVHGKNSENRVSFEMRLLSRIHGHAGLLDDRKLKQAAFSVSRAWSVNHLKRTQETKSKLDDELTNMMVLMEGILGTYQPAEMPSANSPP